MSEIVWFDVQEAPTRQLFDGIRVRPLWTGGIRDYPAGAFIHAPAGSSHVPQTTTGCTLFVFYPDG